MRRLEIRRHSFTKKGESRGRGSHLSQEGVVAARDLGARRGRFDLALASTSPRTLETAIAMGVAVDDVIDMPSPAETGEIEFHAWRAWTDPFTALRLKADESAAVGAYVERETARLVAALDQLPDGGTALVIAHGGWMESVVARLVEPRAAPHLGGSFWHLEGIRLTINAAEPAAVQAIDRYPR